MEEKAKIVNFVTESRSHRDMQAHELQQEQSIPTARIATMQNTLYEAYLARRKPW